MKACPLASTKSQDLLVNIAQHIAQHIPQLNDIGRKKKFALGSQLTNLIFTSEIWLKEVSVFSWLSL